MSWTCPKCGSARTSELFTLTGYNEDIKCRECDHLWQPIKKRKITPHKGGRTVKRSTDVTPAVNEMLTHLWKDHHISLGDIIDEAVRKKYQMLTSKHIADTGGRE